MRNFIFQTLLITILLGGFTANSNAAFYIEPFAGYQFGEGGDGTGAAYGGRLGFSFLGFALGAQYTGFTSTVDEKDNGGTKKEFDFNGNHIGAFASFEFPILIRVWATYFFASEGKIKSFTIDPDDTGPTAAVTGDLKYEGAGTEIGLGFTGLPFIDINFSITNIKYDDNSHPSGADVESDDFTAYMISLSLPLSI